MTVRYREEGKPCVSVLKSPRAVGKGNVLPGMAPTFHVYWGQVRKKALFKPQRVTVMME